MADPDSVNTVERPGTGAEYRQQDLYPGESAVGKGLFFYLRCGSKRGQQLASRFKTTLKEAET
jgi:hypothetical protein